MNEHAGTLRPICIGGAEGMYPLLPPSSPQHSPLPSLPRLLCIVHAPSRFHPLFATNTGGYSPFPAHLKRGCTAKTVFTRAPPSSCATPPCVPPQPTPFAHVPPALVRVCGVRHVLRAGVNGCAQTKMGWGGTAYTPATACPSPCPPFRARNSCHPPSAPAFKWVVQKGAGQSRQVCPPPSLLTLHTVPAHTQTGCNTEQILGLSTPQQERMAQTPCTLLLVAPCK